MSESPAKEAAPSAPKGESVQTTGTSAAVGVDASSQGGGAAEPSDANAKGAGDSSPAPGRSRNRRRRGSGPSKDGAPSSAPSDRKPKGKRPDDKRGGDRKRGGRSRDGRGGGREGRGREGRGRDGRGGRGGGDRSSGTLTAGLFASVADKEVPCRVAGCKKSWTWWGSEQIKAFGQAPPKRMCDEHLAAFHELNDKEVPCRNSGCENTWTWKRGAQLHLIQRQEKLKTPRRLCESCAGEEKSITDTQVPCRTPGCAHTWTWPADAQRRHASWLRREQAKLEEAEAKHNAPAPVETPAVDSSAATKTRADDQPVSAEAKSPHEVVPASNESRSEPGAETPGAETPGAEAAGAETPASETPGSNDVNESTPAVDVDAAPTPAAEDAPAPKKRKRRRRKSKRQKKLQEGPPEKLCGHCSEQIKKLEPLEQSCKVHGCKNTWSWDREHQLRAWVAAGSQTEQGASAAPKAQRRMCISCRDFCRANHDRAVQCGKPECEKTWTYKTGAQLQDQLAGRVADPIKLCEDCMKEQFMAPGVQTGALPEGSEVMPCAVGGCEGTWIYVPGMQLAAVEGDDVPTDRMCDKCRGERDLDARGTIVPAPGHVTEAASKDAEPSAVAGSDASSAQATRSSEDVSEAPAHAAVASESVAPESEEAAKVAVDQAEGGTESPTEGSTDS